jgi:hypothetical protein
LAQLAEAKARKAANEAKIEADKEHDGLDSCTLPLIQPSNHCPRTRFMHFAPYPALKTTAHKSRFSQPTTNNNNKIQNEKETKAKIRIKKCNALT